MRLNPMSLRKELRQRRRRDTTRIAVSGNLAAKPEKLKPTTPGIWRSAINPATPPAIAKR
jgi:hypothetical protein